ncbi:MAG: hypothetical protein BMS9Abin39_0573 [Ignavibacteria bacterium]|nr:MAG: hypothetical protein BMS9Abin39_0573 [Ignavibacteria bacterium]
MKGVLLFGSSHHKRKNSFYAFFKQFILVPAKSGLYGFAAFFTVLIFAKGIINILGFTDFYVINSDDVLFSSLGFVLVYLGKIVKNIIRRTDS